ncbi:hypothetical protein CPB86DRAFT_871560 [Serendipita vermifera]|nr:hypothetical protein CPB86DRAFT_762767 [Serendipita vermifera]PVG00975.1 hypothetical protein CPB86DRAFT_871560 [Serendipita vermifera]
MFRVARVTSNSYSNIGSIWRTPCLARSFSSPAIGRTKKLMPTLMANTSPRPLSSDASPPSPGATTATQEETAKTEKRPPVAWPQRPGQDPSELTAHLKKTAIQYPYFVPRNSNGCVPVYSDFKNNRTKELTLIRNVEGNVQALKDDLVATLFPDTRNNRFDNHRLKTNIRVHHNRHVIIQGGRWAMHVQKWLLARGF